MMARWLEFLETLSTSRIALAVALLVIVCQLVAVGAVASEQVYQGQQRELARKDRRLAEMRCLELQTQHHGAVPGCPHRTIYVAHR
jgi:hypothetical protein